MAISNGYVTLDEAKDYMNPSGQGFSANADDDAILEKLIEGASREIDRISTRTFYARTETHYFDVPTGRILYMDDDLLTITTLTNGNGTAISSNDYGFLQPNKTPYYAVKLLDTSSVIWQNSSSGGSEQVISIAGTWGWSSSTPDDIREFCLAIVKHSYKRRTGNAEQAARVTGAGVVLTPADIPGYVLLGLQIYKRRS